MKTYKIIANEKRFKKFLDWLPDLEENEKFYCCLFARKKYAKGLIHSNDKTQLARFLCTKENMLDKFRQLEIPLGRYKLKSIAAPQHSLVAYINPNPRSMKVANDLMGEHCWSLTKSNGFDLVKEALSMCQKATGRRIWKDYDVDTKEVNLHDLRSIFPYKDYKGEPVYSVVSTKGGYHILVNTKLADLTIKSYNYTSLVPAYTTAFHTEIIAKFPIDEHGDGGNRLMPIPGTYQGNCQVKMIL